MYKYLRLKAVLIVLLVAFALWKAYPPFDQFDKEGNLTKEGTLNLGLDLQGGMYLVLEVDTSELDDEAKKDARERAIEVLRNRLDPQGVKEYPIYPQGRDRIVIQLPGETDRERILKRIKKVAHLEFRLVSDDVDRMKAALDGAPTPGFELLELEEKPILLEKKASLSGDSIVDARVEFSQKTFGEPYVSLTFDDKGARLFSQITAQNVNSRLAIVLDGVIESAPVIRERIPSGRAQITGRFSMDEANDLSIVLRAGALPAPVNVIEERTVGPTLGKDSIQNGIKAIIIGGIIVLSFMFIYYLIAGVVANAALTMNLILILGVLSYFKATLTLPGIAGLVLTVGMAVDANVLIFERIKEELKSGKTLHSGIVSGYNRAFLTILDANVTTLITAVILFQFGTGPVRGFATTLSIGILASVFTAIVVTRVIFDIMTKNKVITRLKMLHLIKETNVNFIGYRKIAYIASLIIIVIGISAFAKRGDKNFGIDFTGGTVQQFKFAEPVSTDEIRASLGRIGMADASVQQFGGNREVIIRTFTDTSEIVIEEFRGSFSHNPFNVTRVEKVGPAIGKDLRGKALLAFFYALIGICIYISLRFEFKFAIAAIIALFHDVIIAVSALVLTGREISIPVIAALLTVVGYSINDTIVIFDRIREDMKIMRKSSFKDILNMSVNQTLSRTILTSMTTLFVVLSLFLFGGEVINDFSFVLLVGVIVGTYSSIFVAGSILADWSHRR
ncbi:MAG: protein translocase subunit SecD [Candidatus Omnitrophica bacterium]|nr:protein translocase subunit SecD [Candidatus Omnitrophota bacterium]